MICRGIVWLAAALVAASCAKPSAGPPPTSLPDAAPAAWKRPPITDFHAHLSLDGADRLRQIMADNGVERFVNLSGGSGRHNAQAWLMAKLLADQFPGKIVNFASPNWRGFGHPDWIARETEALDTAVTQYGFAGVKIAKGLGLGHTDEHDRLVAVDDPRLDPLWRKAADLGIPVCIHVADPRAFWWPLTPRNERWDELGVHPYWAYGPIPDDVMAGFPPQAQELVRQRTPVPSWPAMLQAAERMYRRNPRTTFVAVHFGNAAEDLDYVDGLLQRNPNVWIDTAARVGEFGRHPAGKVRAFFDKWQDRTVFGTDIGIGSDYLMLGSNGEVEPQMADVKPFYDAHWQFFETTARQIAHPSPIQGRWHVDAVGLPAAVLDKIYRSNAAKLLDRNLLKARAASAPAPQPNAAVPPPADPTPAWAQALSQAGTAAAP
ncbi:MAG: amidohydrolase family protein [Deltaproteobacteria bacterium]|nr:amidohydrolase family protein [Deltaproteobacteria bacterium]